MAHSPLLNAIKKHNQEGYASFHMPSHKGNAQILSVLGEALKYDLTELPDTGSLFDSLGAVREAERLATVAFKTQGTFMSAGGCTLPIQAMLRLVAPEGGSIITGRSIHSSAINAMALLGIEPVWILPDNSAGKGFLGRIRAEDVEKALRDKPDIKAIYITSPDYFGVMSDIAAIVDCVKEKDIPVIVDNAHGSHLRLVGNEMHPLDCGAAMTADSAHKTLPVLTGGAWLNIADKRYLEDAKTAMALFASTSPSYLIMLSLDLCRVWMQDNAKQAFGELVDEVQELKKLMQEKGLIFPNGISDPVRLAFNSLKIGYNANSLAKKMRESHLEIEYSDKGRIVLIPSPFNSKDDFKSLKSFVEKISVKTALEDMKFEFKLPPKAMSLRQAFLSKAEFVPIKDSLGRIAAQAACPCPPGIPVTVPGEIIGEFAQNALMEYGIINIKVVKD